MLRRDARVMFKKIREVFTSEYKEDTEYREFVDREINSLKLKNNGENIDKKIERLLKADGSFNFKI